MTTNLLFISVFNLPAIELAKNHITSLLKSGISNTIIKCYVTDAECISLLNSFNVEVFLINTNNISNTYLEFSSPNFNELCLYRYTVTLDLLNRGYNVWYMDVDTVVTQNLLPVYEANKESHDIVMQDDLNMPCTGCILFYNTSNTIQFLTHYIKEYAKQSAVTDQKMWLTTLINYNIGLRFKVLPWHQFACGVLYFRELQDKASSRIIKCIHEFEPQRDKVMFVHANWMIGNDIKIEALKKYGHWYI